MNISMGNATLFGKCLGAGSFEIGELTYEIKDDDQFSILNTDRNIMYTATIKNIYNAFDFEGFCKAVLEEFKKGNC